MALSKNGVELVLVHGQPTRQEASRRDTAELQWALPVANTSVNVKGRDILWQPEHLLARDAVLRIVMQESRILSNYQLLLKRALRGRSLVAFWGHGRNFQSRHPDGWRERWKVWWLNRADWWFAYTDSTREHLVANGYPGTRITTLNNAIDGTGFAQDLQAISNEELVERRHSLGIGADANVAIHCGSLYPEKRIDILIAAGDILRTRLPDFHLLVVGDGPMSSSLRDAASARPWLHVLGTRNGREKAALFRMAAVQLNPGLVGLHVVDSFVARTPLITQASALHSPEFAYLKDGVNGLALQDDSPTAYAHAVAQLFERPEMLASLQKACAGDAKYYSLDSMVTRFSEGILDCLRFHGFTIEDSAPAAPSVLNTTRF